MLEIGVDSVVTAAKEDAMKFIKIKIVKVQIN